MDDVGKVLANGFGVVMGIVAAFYFLGKILAFFGFVLWITSPFWLGMIVGWLWVLAIWKIRSIRYDRSWEVADQKEKENEALSRQIDEYNNRKVQLIQKQHDVFIARTYSEIVDFVQAKREQLEKQYNDIAHRFYRDVVPSEYVDGVFGKHLDGALPKTFEPSQHFQDDYSILYESLFDGRPDRGSLFK